MNLISPPELQYITTSLLAGKRNDGRSLFQFRDIVLSPNVVAQSAGSARVSCGGTDIIVGIRLEAESIHAGDNDRIELSLEV
jgi:exosome complex component RRP42